MLPAGEWFVRGTLADYRHINTEKQITLRPGEEKSVGFTFNAGRVQFDITLNGGPYNGQLSWEVFEAKEDFSGNRRKVANASRVKPGHVTYLHAGEYIVHAFDPDNKATKSEMKFSVKAGDDFSLKLDFKKP